MLKVAAPSWPAAPMFPRNRGNPGLDGGQELNWAAQPSRVNAGRPPSIGTGASIPKSEAIHDLTLYPALGWSPRTWG